MFRKPGFIGTQKSHVCKYQKQSIRNKKKTKTKKQKTPQKTKVVVGVNLSWKKKGCLSYIR